VEEGETLRTLAEIGIALAGFTGIVAVLGRRARGDWTPLELAQMRLLLEASLGVVFFSLLPVLLQMAVESHQTTWRIANVFLAVFQISIMALFFRRALLVAVPNLPASGRRVAYPLAGAGIAVIAAQLLAGIGMVREASLTYLLGLIWFLVIAALTFVYLLLPRRG
jgi:hypothetical protein